MRRLVSIAAVAALGGCNADMTSGSLFDDASGSADDDDGTGGDDSADDVGDDDGDDGDATDASADGSTGASTLDGGSTGGDDETTTDPTIADDSTSSASTEGTTDGDGESSSDEGTDDGGNGDQDDDGLPDGDDPFPADPMLPGYVEQNVIYAHTSAELYTMSAYEPYDIAFVGNFSFPQGGVGQVTDAAIDRFGVLYVVTFDDFFVCNPATAACYLLGALPEQHNALTFIPPGTLDDDDDSLIGIANSGAWRYLELDGNMVSMMQLGSYGGGYTSSGDSFSILDVGTYSSVDGPGTFDDIVIEVDPLTGTAMGEVGTLTGYTSTYGLAGWDGAIFAFDESGDVLLVDPVSGTFEVINDTTHAWWGAAVGTVLPQ